MSKLVQSIAVALFLMLSVAAPSALADGVADLKAGAAAYDKDDYAGAEKLFDSAIKSGDLKGDTLALAYSLRGLTLWAQEKRDSALQDFNKAIELASVGQRVWNNAIEHRCILQLAMRKYRESAVDFLTLAQWNPELAKSIRFENILRLVFGVEKVDEGVTFDVLTALKKIAYQPHDPGDSFDSLAGLYVRLLVQRGDKAKALAEIATITATDTLITLRIDRRLEPIWQDPAYQRATNPVDMAQRDLSAKEQAFQKFPNVASVIRDYVAALRVVGQYDKSISVARAALSNVGTLKVEDEGDELWLRNELVYSYKASGHIDDMLAEMTAILSIDPAKNGNVVSQFINYAEIYIDLGRNAEGVALAQRAWDQSSPYGKMWVQQITVCGSVVSDPGLADRTLDEMRKKRDDNYAAFTTALLCTNHLDEVAATLKARLATPAERGSVLNAVQRYKAPQFVTDSQRQMVDRYRSVVDRPDVKSEIEKYGRVESFPFVSEYWGNV